MTYKYDVDKTPHVYRLVASSNGEEEVTYVHTKHLAEKTLRLQLEEDRENGDSYILTDRARALLEGR